MDVDDWAYSTGDELNPKDNDTDNENENENDKINYKDYLEDFKMKNLDENNDIIDIVDNNIINNKNDKDEININAIDEDNNLTINNRIKRPDSLYDKSIIKNEGLLTNNNNNKSVKFNNGNKSVTGKSQNTNNYKKDKDKEKSRSSLTSSISDDDDESSEDDSSFEHLAEPPPPDGGWGWVVVAASFMVNLIADGITFSFGVIFVEFINYFNESKAKTAWIGSLFMAMPLLSGPIASFMTDRYGCRRVSIVGSILATLGFVISSFANSLGVLILTFGVLAGFGLSLCFVAAVVIVAYYFDKKRSFATGLSVCGSGIGTFIFPPLTQYLLAEYGWRGTTLILAGFFSNLAVCGCLMRDLEWTTVRAKAQCAQRKRIREKKRSSKIQSSSADSFSASSSVNTTTQTPHNINNSLLVNNIIPDSVNYRLQNNDDINGKLFSSLVTLPTFLKNGDQVPLEVLDLLAMRKDVCNVLLNNHPNLWTSSRSLNNPAIFNDHLLTTTTTAISTVPSTPTKNLNLNINSSQNNLNVLLNHNDEENDDDNDNENDMKSKLNNKDNIGDAYLKWLQKFPFDSRLRQDTLAVQRTIPAAYLKHIRVHRHSLTYRGAMLNINRYRLRASSCPDIYRNSMTTSAKNKLDSINSGFYDFWDLIVDMLDFSHFSDSRFLLFSISNFLLHFWYDVPYVYLTDNAIETGFTETQASILISVVGIANMFGEIFLGWAGDKAWVNPSIVYASCMIICGAFTSLIPLVMGNYYALNAVSGAFGLFIAANYSLTSIIIVEVITIERFANAYGLLLLVQGVANLMGPPLAGWLYDITKTYNLSFYLAGFFIALSGFLLLIVPLIEFYKKRFKKHDTVVANKDCNNV